jgi:hypothetical protein
MKRTQRITERSHLACVRPGKIVVVTCPEVTDPERTAKIRDRLERDELTFELGVETAEAGITFLYWPYRCLSAKEFRRGYMSAVTIEERPDLKISEDGFTIISTKIN